jgi:putative oxidoreductase
LNRRMSGGALTGGLFDPTLAPLAVWTDAVVLIARLIVGVLMLYYGWPKLKDPAKNAHDFERDGFKPGWVFGTLVLLAEFFGGILVLLGVYVWVAAAAFGFEMLLGAIVKAIKWKKPVTDYSYDLLLLALCLVLLALGPGAYSITRLVG